MMRAQLDDVHERGEPIAALWASEETIYGRYGYGLASLNAQFDVDKSFYRVPPGRGDGRPRAPGRLRRRRAAASHRSTTPMQRSRRACSSVPRPGGEPAARRPPRIPVGGGPKHIAVLEVDGEPQAYAIYRLHGDLGGLGPETKLRAIEVIATTPEATASLWRYLLDIDWTKAVDGRGCCRSTTRSPPARPPEPGAADPSRATASGCGSSTSARRCRARATPGEGAIVFDVRDGFCPWNEGRWRLEGGQAVEDRGGRRTSRSTSPTSAPSTSAASRSASSAAPAASRSCSGRGRPGGLRSSGRTSRPGAPRSSEMLWTIRGDSACRMSSGALE